MWVVTNLCHSHRFFNLFRNTFKVFFWYPWKEIWSLILNKTETSSEINGSVWLNWPQRFRCRSKPSFMWNFIVCFSIQPFIRLKFIIDVHQTDKIVKSGSKFQKLNYMQFSNTNFIPKYRDLLKIQVQDQVQEIFRWHTHSLSPNHFDTLIKWYLSERKITFL